MRIHRDATADDLQQITGLLSQHRLPADDCAEHIENFILLEDQGRVIGIGGLENHGVVGLIRSMVVIPECRGQGVGNQLYSLIKQRASALGIERLYLLTETASDYFIRLGYTVHNRAEAPPEIVNTKQFQQLCPASAILLSCDISQP